MRSRRGNSGVNSRVMLGKLPKTTDIDETSSAYASIFGHRELRLNYKEQTYVDL